MRHRIRNSQDFWSGVMFMAFGGLAMFLARTYPMGTASRMGPGYFPTTLGGLLALIGLVVALRALRHPGEPVQRFFSAPMNLILGSVLGFALLLPFAGLIPSIVVLVVVSSLAGGSLRWKTVGIETALLCLVATALFVWGLGLPFSLFGPR
ncbi:MAG: tripartite tricarboxylate transporter TctB family protein [Rhodospirillales bacterium]|nr:tripartite tricarboxylate transporter TctB family protein [Rhodospirillales bacterium]